jgi:hypothetical protein
MDNQSNPDYPGSDYSQTDIPESQLNKVKHCTEQVKKSHAADHWGADHAGSILSFSRF